MHQCCGSGMFIPDPGSWFLPIPDPGSKNSNKREGWKKICCLLCSHKFHKIANYFRFEVLKKKIWANFQIIIELFTQKIVNKFSKIWGWDPGSEIWDPGSGKNLFRSPDPGVKKAPAPGSGSSTLLCTVQIKIVNDLTDLFLEAGTESGLNHSGTSTMVKNKLNYWMLPWWSCPGEEAGGPRCRPGAGRWSPCPWCRARPPAAAASSLSGSGTQPEQHHA